MQVAEKLAAASGALAAPTKPRSRSRRIPRHPPSTRPPPLRLARRRLPHQCALEQSPSRPPPQRRWARFALRQQAQRRPPGQPVAPAQPGPPPHSAAHHAARTAALSAALAAAAASRPAASRRSCRRANPRPPPLLCSARRLPRKPAFAHPASALAGERRWAHVKQPLVTPCGRRRHASPPQRHGFRRKNLKRHRNGPNTGAQRACSTKAGGRSFHRDPCTARARSRSGMPCAAAPATLRTAPQPHASAAMALRRQPAAPRPGAATRPAHVDAFGHSMLRA